MTLISRIIAVLLFILFFSFALKNTHEVALHLFLQYELRGPLVLMLLGFFLVGALLGILAMTPTVFRHRREGMKYKQELDARTAAARDAARPGVVAQPDIVSN
jgi:uncharacterized integral membrane protein